MANKLTKITSTVLDDDIVVKTLNGGEISIIAKPGAIPQANASGELDGSWGVTGGGGGGTGDMSRSTYDTNGNGVVDRAEASDKMSPTSTANKYWGTSSSNVQGWQDPSTLTLTKAVYDPTNSGKVLAAQTADKLPATSNANMLWGTNNLSEQGWIPTRNGNMSTEVYDYDSNGVVNEADEAYKLKASVANSIWGSDANNIQKWFSVNPNNIMTTDNYGVTAVSPLPVALAKNADNLSSEITASPGTVYMKNSLGIVEWTTLSNLVDGAMLQEEYGYKEGNNFIQGVVKESNEARKIKGTVYSSIWGTDSSGVQQWFLKDPSLLMTSDIYGENSSNPSAVALAKEAVSLRSEGSAAVNTVYMKNAGGDIGWFSISNIVGDAMLKSEYGYIYEGLQVEGVVATANVANNILGYENVNNLSYYGKNDDFIGWHSFDSLASIYMKVTDWTENSKLNADSLKFAESALNDDNLPTTLLGIIKSGGTNDSMALGSLEQFIDKTTCIKSSWCGIKATATSNGTTTTFTNIQGNTTANKTLFKYDAVAGFSSSVKDLYKQFLNFEEFDSSITSSTKFTAEEAMYVKITFYNVETSTAQCKINSNNISPVTNNFSSVPIKLNAGDVITLTSSTNATFEFCIEVI